MKAKTLQIVWHTKEPVFSVDFHPDGYIATGGADKDIKMWELNCAADGTPGVRYVATLEGHNATVNCVRFSKTGHSLATAGDAGELMIWKPVPAAPASAAETPAIISATHGTGSPGSNTPRLPPASTAVAASATPASAAKASASAFHAHDTAAAKDADQDAEGVVCGVKWKLSHTLRGHHGDVTDVAWAHDDAALLSGSVENEVMMFDVQSRSNLQRLIGHKHYVQGVAWDPLGACLVSASADRSVRVYNIKPQATGGKQSTAVKTSAQLARDYIHTATLLKRTLPAPQTPPRCEGTQAADATAAVTDAATEQAAGCTVTAAAEQQQQQLPSKPLQTFLFQDESLGVFFRRLAWSPDGMLLAIPAGVNKAAKGHSASQHMTYVYARGHWSNPAASLPCPSKASTAVKFCPLLFKLRQPSSSSSEGEPAAATAVNALGLPYRLVLAVATTDSVLLYDMQTLEPFCLIGPLHYDQITDMAWSRDGSCLAVSSRDGYCSLVTFQPGELGDVINHDELPAGYQAASKAAALAAATAAKSSGGVAAAAVMPAPVRPGSAAAAVVAASSVPTSAEKSQQQQRPAVRRIQPQAVTPTAAAAAAGSPGMAAAAAVPPVVAAAVGCSQLRRISPSPVTASPPAAAATRPSSSSKAAAPRRLTPTPVSPPAAAAARFSDTTVVDLTADEEPATAIAAAAQPVPSSRGSKAGNGSTPNAAAAPAPRRLTPQPVLPAEQQQQASPAAVAAATGAASQSRTGVAAVMAAMAAAKKKAAAKRAADGGSDAAAEAETKRAKVAEL